MKHTHKIFLFITAISAALLLGFFLAFGSAGDNRNAEREPMESVLNTETITYEEAVALEKKEMEKLISKVKQMDYAIALSGFEYPEFLNNSFDAVFPEVNFDMELLNIYKALPFALESVYGIKPESIVYEGLEYDEDLDMYLDALRSGTHVYHVFIVYETMTAYVSEVEQ